MKLLQLNIEGGRRLKEIAEFIKQGDYDFVTMQEVTGGDRFQLRHHSGTRPDEHNYPTQDCFLELQERLDNYEGILEKNFTDKSGKAYFGNATFYKSTHKLEGTKVIIMREERIVELDDKDAETYPYKALATEFKAGNQSFQLVQGHFSWAPRPYDTNLTIKLAQKVRDYITNLDLPFILTGDFNVDYRTITMQQFAPFAKNLTAELNIPTTLNPHTHRAEHLFPPGIACDHMLVSPRIANWGFKVIRENLSDHFGLELEFELKPLQQEAVGGLEQRQAAGTTPKDMK